MPMVTVLWANIERTVVVNNEGLPMIAVVQRVIEASVQVGHELIGGIGAGLLVLLAVHRSDSSTDVTWMANKLARLRAFDQEERGFHLNVTQAGGAILLVSNFTVAARTRAGNRPSFDDAAEPAVAAKLFDSLAQTIRSSGVQVETGRFGAHMRVSLTNDGPVTLILDSRQPSQSGVQDPSQRRQEP
jgi:D-tyrosyl-tRNA(Tyr) deacylase